MDMSKQWKRRIQILLVAVVVPGVILSLAARLCIHSRAEKPQEEGTMRLSIPVYQPDGRVQQMGLEDYICRVVLGEVSTGFHSEALKAQAVAARTYTLRCVRNGNKHPQGAVCTDHRCCQAYCEPEEYLSSGGTEDGLKKIRSAVDATCGEVLYYGEELICATYFASSGGTTEDAKAVWGQSYPYLLSVPSPEDAQDHTRQVSFTPEEFQKRLGVTLTGEPQSWFGMVAYTQGKGVALMRIGARLYTGVQLRNLLELRSTVISVEIRDQQIIFTTKGYGHRVGMSQHGANGMAKNGQDYRSILTHYYQNVTVDQFRYNDH